MKLQELFDRKEYEKILAFEIKMNKFSEYEELLVAKTHFEMGNFEKTKKYIDKNIYEHKYYYEYLIMRVDMYIEEGKYIDAAIVVREELNMPYLEEKYKLYFENILSLIIDKQYKNKVEEKDIEEMLLSEDEDNKILAISLMRKLNVRDFINIISETLVEVNTPLKIKNLLIDLLDEQGINKDIELSFDSFYELINIKKYTSDKNKLITNLVESYNFNHSNIQNSVNEIVTVIVINTYPQNITYDQYYVTIEALLLQMFNKEVENNKVNMDLLDYFKSIIY